MTVILVLLTFAVFILIDTVLSRKKVPVAASVAQPVGAAATLDPSYVDGFLVHQNVRYHVGHGWLLRERKNLMRVGADEFAAALAGRIDQIELPKPGHWIRQGQRAWSFLRGGEKAEMV